MIRKTLSLLIVFLLLSSSFAYAAVPGQTKQGSEPDKTRSRDEAKTYNIPDDDSSLEEEIGEDIVINIDQYQPRIIRTSLLEEQDINVYALLAGIPSNPIISIDKITGISVKPVKIKTKPEDKKVTIGSVRYIKPQGQGYAGFNYLSDANSGITRSRNSGSFTDFGYTPEIDYNNLGTVVVPIKRIPKEKDVPDSIDIELEGKISLYVAEDLGHSKYHMALQQLSEAEWLKQKESYQFYAGYVRAVSIEKNTAEFDVYDVNGNKITKAPISIRERERKVFRTKSFYDNIMGFGSLFDKYYIALDDIRARSRSVNALIYKENGDVEIGTISEGAKLYPGSNWVVTSIEDISEKGRDVKKVTLTAADGKKQETIMFGEGVSSTEEENIKKKADESGFKEHPEDDDNCKLKVGNEEKNAYNAIKDIGDKLDSKKIEDNKNVNEGKEINDDGAFFNSDITNLKSIKTNNQKIGDVNACSASMKRKADDMLRKIYNYYFERLNKLTAKAELIDDGEEKGIINNKVNELNQKIKDIEEILGDKNVDKQTYLESGSNEEYLLNAIGAYQEVVEKYQDQPQAKAAQKKMAWIYSYIGDETNAIRALEEYHDNSADEREKAKTREEINRIKKSLTLKSEAKKIQDGNNFIVVYLTDVVLPRGKGSSYAAISVDDGPEQQVSEGSAITGLPGYRVKTIDDYGITVYSESKKEKVEIDVNDYEKVEILEGDERRDVRVNVRLVNLQMEAMVTIEPVSEKAESFVKFNLHLPIEKRPFELPLFSKTIDEEINKTQRLIDKLNKITSNVGKIHNYWTKGCYATAGVLLVKNLVGGGSRVMAREKVRDAWYRKYQEDKSAGKAKGSFDSFVLKNSGTYERDIKTVENAVNKLKSKDFSGIPDDYKKLVENGNVPESLNDWYIARNLAEADPTSYMDKFLAEDLSITKDVAEKKAIDYFKTLDSDYGNKKDLLEGKLGYTISKNEYFLNKEKLFSIYRQELVNEEINKKIGGENKADVWLRANNLDGLLDNRKLEHQKLFEKLTKDIEGLNSAYTGKYEPIKAIDKFDIIEVSENNVKYYYYKDRSNGKTYELYKLNSKSDPEQFKVSKSKDEDISPYVQKKDGKSNAEPLYVLIPGDIQTEAGALASLLMAGAAAYTLSGNRKLYEYAVTSGEPKEKHKPVITRIGKGNRNEGLVSQISIDAMHYVEFEYDSNGRIIKKTLWERAVPNAEMGGSLDRQLDLQLELNKAKALGGDHTDYRKALENVDGCTSKLNNQLSRTKTYNKGDKVRCSDLGSYAITEQSKDIKSGPNCVDFMDPGDCKMMFNACDPVICPTTRCNLGGKWQVENVVQTGLIGSVVLCLPNAGEVAMPVCITGINAGLQNVNSILKGYKECLMVQKVKGQSVGVCDRIRNVYICDMLWREGLAIFNVKGGLVSLMSEKLLNSDGGSEYGSFKESFSNSVDSMKYFTQSYAKNVFASYKGGSLDEIGTEVCKAAIFGKVPGVGNIFDQVQKPESPPQFMAFFDVVPYQDVARIPTSLYSIYYHIYAGENEDISYSVYMKGGDALSGIALRPLFIMQNKRLGKGEFADENFDREYPGGYDEICVDIQSARYNKISQCGFGKVTTDFGLNYLNDMYFASEAKKMIKSEKECVSEAGRLSDLSYAGKGEFTGSSSGYNIAKTGTGLFSSGLAQTGIVRKCSAVDPDITEKDEWKPVGNCGTDEKGRDLGVCYLYMASVRELLRDESRKTETENSISEMKKLIDDKQGFSLAMLSQRDIAELKTAGDIALVNCRNKDTVDECDKAIEYYNKVVIKSDENSVRADAQFGIGEAYVKKYFALEKKSEEEDNGGDKPTIKETNGEFDNKVKKGENNGNGGKPKKDDSGTGDEKSSDNDLSFLNSKNEVIKESYVTTDDKYISLVAVLNGACNGPYTIIIVTDVDGISNNKYNYRGLKGNDLGDNSCKIEQKHNPPSENLLLYFNVFNKDGKNLGRSPNIRLFPNPVSVFKDAYLAKLESNSGLIKLKDGQQLKVNDELYLVARFNAGCNLKNIFELRLFEDDFFDKQFGTFSGKLKNDCIIEAGPYKITGNEFDRIGDTELYFTVFDYDKKSEVGDSVKIKVKQSK